MENVIEEKSFDFAVRVVNLYKHLRINHKEFVMSKQLLKSGTSIGANVYEAQKAQSRADFHSKMTVALKESNETLYWLKLLYRTNFLAQKEFESIEADIREIIAILTSVCRKTDDK